MAGGGLTGAGSNLMPSGTGQDPGWISKADLGKIDISDIILYAKSSKQDQPKGDPTGDRSASSSDDGASQDGDIATQTRKAMDFDAVQGRSYNTGDNSGDQNTDGGDVRLAQANTGTMTDAPAGGGKRTLPKPGILGPAAVAAQILDRIDDKRERAAVEDAIEKFGLDRNDPKDVNAARAYVWGKNMAPMHIWKAPVDSHDPAGNERVAQSIMRLEQAHPGTLGKAIQGDPDARARLDAAVDGALAGQVYGQSAAGTDDQSKTKAPPTTLTKPGERHDDDSCAPKGTDGAWVVVNRGGMSDDAEAYQQQITKTPDLPGKAMIEYEVTDRATGDSVKMDGCAVWSEDKQLLDAKYASGKSKDIDQRAPDVSKQIMRKEVDQARDQAGIVGGEHPVEWHVSEGSAQPRFKQAVDDGTGRAPNFSVIHTPAAD